MVKSAVIVIDMIKGMERWIPKERMKRIQPNIRAIMDAARERKIPVIYIIHKPLGKNGTKIYEQVKPATSDFRITKNEFSSFYKTKLDMLLKKLKVKRLILTGVSTHWCVMTTAVDASYRGYEIILLEDCTTAPNDEWHRWAIKWMKNSFDLTVTTQRNIGRFL